VCRKIHANIEKLAKVCHDISILSTKQISYLNYTVTKESTFIQNAY
jgi:hypothetical protein